MPLLCSGLVASRDGKATCPGGEAAHTRPGGHRVCWDRVVLGTGSHDIGHARTSLGQPRPLGPHASPCYLHLSSLTRACGTSHSPGLGFTQLSAGRLLRGGEGQVLIAGWAEAAPTPGCQVLGPSLPRTCIWMETPGSGPLPGGQKDSVPLPVVLGDPQALRRQCLVPPLASTKSPSWLSFLHGELYAGQIAVPEPPPAGHVHHHV